MTPNLIDIDGDNKKEVLVSSFKLSLSKIISVLLSGKADIDVFVFGLQDGVYAQKPLADKEVKMRINLRSGRQTFPMIRTVDIDGNKVKDLLLSDDDEIEIHLAQQGRGSLYKRRDSTFDFAMPTDANRIAHADVNGDGKGDLVISYTQADGQEKANQVSVLYAN